MAVYPALGDVNLSTPKRLENFNHISMLLCVACRLTSRSGETLPTPVRRLGATRATAVGAVDEGLAESEHDAVDDMVQNAFDSVVRVYCTHAEHELTMPWQRSRQYSSTSSAFVIATPTPDDPTRRRIITNAHAVEHGTMVQVRKRGDDRKYQATVEHLGQECDLAMLSVDDDSDFWDGLVPLGMGESVPSLQVRV